MIQPTDISHSPAFTLIYFPVNTGDVITERTISDLPLGTIFDVVSTPSYPKTSAAQGWRKIRYEVKMVHHKHLGDSRVYEVVNKRALTPDEIAYFEELVHGG